MRQSSSFTLEKDIERILMKVKLVNECEHSFSNTYRDLLSAENRIVL